MTSFLPQPQIQSYVNTAAGSSIAEWSGAFRPGTSLIFGTGPANAQTYLSQFSFTTGVLISQQNINNLGVYAEFQGTLLYGADGSIWLFNSSNAGGTPLLSLCRIEPSGSSYAVTDKWGDGGLALPTSAPNYIANSVYLTMGTTHWIVGGSFSATNVNYSVVAYRADPPAYPVGNFGFWGHAYNNSGAIAGNTDVCAGPQSAASATAYWTNKPESIYGTTFNLGKTVISAGAGSYSPATWPTPNGNIASSIIKQLVPTDFDAAWGAFTFLSGPAYDQTDGNVLVQISGSGGGNANYIAKLSVSTGAIVWKVAVNGVGFDAEAVSLSRIYFGTFYYWDGTNCHAINTTSGADTLQAFSVTLAIGQQISDDVLGCITGNVQWSGAGLMLLNATAASGNTAGAVYMAQGGGGGGEGNGLPYDAVRRVWTFTLDGHTFYVLQLGPQGTWVYDSTTQEWAQWDTATYGIWNMINGCMWGYRIVAGSSQTTDVWELAPSLMVDEGIFNIDHAVTGILDVRSRKYYAVDALSITASAGILDETSGATFSLRFSDDQGQTWSAYYTLALGGSDFSEEIAWRSLGSFGRPGRVFELSDVGGLVRIDGADVFIDNFDEDEPQQGGQQQ